MKRIIITTILLLSLIFTMAVPCLASGVTSFSDLPKSHWAYSTVMDMVEKGLFKGTTAPVNGVGTFSPDKPMTRGEFLAVVCRMYFPDEIYTPAPDIPWWDPYFTIAVMHGLIDYQRQFVELDSDITRGDAVRIIVNLMEAVGTPLTDKYSGGFTDGDAIKKYDDGLTVFPDLAVSFKLCAGEGIIQGVDAENSMDPSGNRTRAQAATLLSRLSDESKRLKNDFTQKVEYDKIKYHNMCVQDVHFADTSNVEVLKYAGPNQSGTYRIHCDFCDYYFDYAFRSHQCKNNSLRIYTCGDKIWTGYDCGEFRIIDTNDSKIFDHGTYLRSGEKYYLTIQCHNHYSSAYNQKNVNNYEDALHKFGEWKITAYPGRGVEGRVAQTCSECGYQNFKILPMYPSAGYPLNIRDSYRTFNYGSFASYSDIGATEHERVRYTSLKNGFENADAFATYAWNVSWRTYGDDSRYPFYIYHPANGQLGVNIYGLRSPGDQSINWHGSYFQIVCEMFYFLSRDREVAYALWSVLDFMYLNGADVTTAEKIATFGFEVYDETANSIKLRMKGVTIVWTWGGDIPGNQFYFYYQ